MKGWRDDRAVHPSIPSSLHPSLAATAFVVAAAAGFGAIPVFTAIATESGTALETVLAWRYVLGGALLLPLGLAPLGGGAAGGRPPARRALTLVLVGGGGQAVVAFVTLSALRWISPATLGFLFFTYPAWVALFAAVSGAERLTAWRAAALALALGGIALIIGAPAGGLHPAGVGLALAGAVVYALYVPTIGRLQRGLAPAGAAVCITGGAAAAFLVGGWAADTLTWALAPRAWAAVAGLAALSTAAAFVLFLRGLAALGPVRTAIVGTVEPFWTALLSAALLAQPLAATTLAGGAMIAGAVVVLQRGPRGGRALATPDQEGPNGDG